MSFLLKITLGQLLIAALVLLVPTARNLEYEYAWLVSISLVVVASLVCMINPLGLRNSAEAMTWKFLSTLALTPFVMLVPGILAFTSGQCPCSPNGFYFWMLILVIPAAWLGFALIEATAWSLESGRNRLRYLIAALPISSILLSLVCLWFMPQKRITSFALGFIHGPIYDRFIEVDGGILLIRLGHGTLGLLLVALAGGLVSIRSRLFQVLFVFVTAIFAAGFSYPSQGHGLWALERQVPKVIKIETIELRYASGKPGADENARRLALDAVFHVQEIKQYLGIQLTKPILIFAYQSEREKKLLFGGGQTDVTDVWTPTIHIQLEESPHPTLRHELVHAVASFTSWHNLGFHPNMVLTEGLAMALAPTDFSLTFDQLAAGLIKSGRAGDLESLFHPLGFWSEAGGRSYAVAGSIIRWLSARFGPAAVRALYSGTSLEEICGKSSAELLAEWKKDILSRYASDAEILVESLTREPGVLADLCPHSIADLARKRSDGWFVRIRQPIGWDPELWAEWRARLNPMDREARLDAARKSLKTLFDSNKHDTSGIGVWIDVMEKFRVWPPKVIEDIEAAIIESDLLLISAKRFESDGLLTKLNDYVKTRSVGPAIARQVEARIALNSVGQQIDQAAWRRYLAGWDSLPVLSEEPSWVELYLRGRREMHPAEELINVWSSSLPSGTDFIEIKKEWLKMIGRSYGQISQFDRAARAFGELASISNGEAGFLALENKRRMEFLKEYSSK